MDRSMYAAFFEGIENEIVFEEYFYKNTNIDPSSVSFVPRINTLRTQANRKFFKFLMKLLWLSWPFLSSILFSFLIFSFLILKKTFIRNISLDNNKILAFCTSVIGYNRIRDAIGESDVFVVIRPFDSVRKYNSQSILNILSMVSYIQVCKALIGSIFVSLMMLKDKKHNNWRLMSYMSMEWFVVYYALNNKQDKIISDHFDRWAVLLDRLSAKQSFSLTIVQHGIILKDSLANSLVFNLKTKLKNVSQIYVFDERSKNVFCTDVLCDSSTTTFSSYHPQITLKKIFDDDVLTVLFVGHVACLDFHLSVLNCCRNEGKLQNVNFLYKPHPTQPITEKLKVQDWLLYQDASSFPDVDVVVSYPSTLGYEYQLMNKTVIQHELVEEPDEAWLVTSKVCEALTRD